MAVNDDRPLEADPAPRTERAHRNAAAEPDSSVDRTVSTVLEGVDRVAEKIKGLLGSHR